MLPKNNKSTYGINSDVILNDIEAISMKMKLIFILEYEEYNHIIHF